MYPYFVLGVPETASQAEIDGAYRRLVQRHPPDRDGERFQIVRQAYEALATPVKRREVRLFYFDEAGVSLLDALPVWMAARARSRMPVASLAARIPEGGE